MILIFVSCLMLKSNVCRVDYRPVDECPTDQRVVVQIWKADMPNRWLRSVSCRPKKPDGWA
jgi:hypothetical protein